MKSVLIANTNPAEAGVLKGILGREYNVTILKSPHEGLHRLDAWDLILLDHNFTEHSGLDFLLNVLKDHHLPILILTELDDVDATMEAMRIGAFNYIVKVNDYRGILNFSVREAIEKFNDHVRMKQTILDLKKEVAALKAHLGGTGTAHPGDAGTAKPKQTRLPTQPKAKPSVIEDIIGRFRRGEINLPSLPHITTQFREMINEGRSLQEISSLLKQDIAISSKLISVSNSAYYQGIVENKNVDQAVGRLGLSVTKQYVEVICNRALFTTENKKFVAIMEKLWEHSLACAYASQILSDTLRLGLSEEVFTMGLLHDIGKLVLIQAVSELDIEGKLSGEEDGRTTITTLNKFHGKVGSALLRKWKFSTEYVQVALHHDNLKPVDHVPKKLLIVHFSNLLVKAMGYTLATPTAIDLESSESNRVLGLDSDRIARIKEAVTERMEGVGVFFV